jgi:hypothetical protein
MLADNINSVFGSPIAVPSPLANFGLVEKGGLGNFLNLAMKLMIIGAAVFALFNLILAGYAFMSAGEDPKKMAGAWAKIWQTMLGLLFAAGSFLLAAIFGKLIFGDWNAILNPSIPTL